MADISTPKNPLPPKLRPSRIIAVSPTLMLSEGPLTPLSSSLQSKATDLEQTTLMKKQVHSRLCSAEKIERSVLEEVDAEKEELQRALLQSEIRFQSQSERMLAIEDEYRREMETTKVALSDTKATLRAEERLRLEGRRECHRLSKQKATLEGYLQEIPSLSEYEDLKRALEQKRGTSDRLTSQFEATQEDLKAKEDLAASLQIKLRQANLKVEDLEVRLRTQEQANMSHERQKVEVESMTEKDYQDTLAVRDKLLAENVSLKKYIVLSKRRNSSELRLHTEDLTVARKSIAALDIEVGRLQETEASLLATNGLLRGQVESAYGQLSEMKAKASALQRALATATVSSATPQTVLEAQNELGINLSEAVAEFESLTTACRQIIEGGDPDISCLLGIDPVSPEMSSTTHHVHCNNEEEEEDTLDRMSNLATNVCELRRGIKEMRDELSDKYAASLAEATTHACFTQ